jgi:hypothetical protein
MTKLGPGLIAPRVTAPVMLRTDTIISIFCAPRPTLAPEP